MRFFIPLANGIRDKRRSFTYGVAAPFICALMSDVGQYWKTLNLTVNDYTIFDSHFMMKLVGHPMTGLFDRCADQFEVFSRFFAMAEG